MDIAVAELNAAKTIRDHGPAESVTYTPSGGDPVTRQALINRQPRSKFSGGPVVIVAEITFVNDAAEGIAATTIKTGLDKVAFKERIDDTGSTDRTIISVVHLDHGSVTVGVT